jgi:hypothetical protein
MLLVGRGRQIDKGGGVGTFTIIHRDDDWTSLCKVLNTI